jgi:hypothetical protein
MAILDCEVDSVHSDDSHSGDEPEDLDQKPSARDAQSDISNASDDQSDDDSSSNNQSDANKVSESFLI